MLRGQGGSKRANKRHSLLYAHAWVEECEFESRSDSMARSSVFVECIGVTEERKMQDVPDSWRG